VAFFTRLGILEGKGMQLCIVPSKATYKATLFFAYLIDEVQFTHEFVKGMKKDWKDDEFKIAKSLLSQFLTPSYFNVNELEYELYTELGNEALTLYNSYNF
jgi:hypothetical protein